MHSSKSELNAPIAQPTPAYQATNMGTLPDGFYAKKDVYYQGARKELLPYFPKGGKTALDVGCGEGWFGSGLKQTFDAEVWGVDISESSIAIAENNLRIAGCRQGHAHRGLQTETCASRAADRDMRARVRVCVYV